MQPQPYSNRELDQFFKAADERADAFHNKLMERMDVFESNTSTALNSIEQQTKKTNGSVASLKLWRAYLTGALAIISLLVVGLLLPLGVIYIDNHYVQPQYRN